MYMFILLALVSLVGFIIIELPPGSYVETRIAQLETQGARVDQAMIDSLIRQYDLDKPVYSRYARWLGKFMQGNLGYSLQWNKPVVELVGERMPATLLLSLFSLVFVYAVAIPIGIYSAVRQYSVGDYLFTFGGFIGLATPNFLLALALMYFFYSVFGVSLTGLFSALYRSAPWSFAKFLDLLKHLPIPIVVVGTAGTAGLIRVMRGCLLDELKKQYVIVARSKGVSERTLLFRYPVRVALNPIISTVGWALPGIFSGQVITSIVLSLPTIGALFYSALRAQDMYLAGSIMVLLSALTIIGTFISDMLLAWADPRIRFDRS
jgi:peptide/nickel transport system permease protein